MTRLSPFCMAALTTLSACQASVTPEPTLSQMPPVISSEMSWLGGCWQTADGKTSETWTIADASHNFAINYSVKDNAVSFFEFTRIDKANGDWAFHAYPRGIGPSTFPVVSQGSQTITFENEAHDYPQRITYTRQGDILKARISLANGENPYDWAFTPCS